MSIQPRKPIRSYRDLEVWQKGVQLVVDCYQLTRSLPRPEQYGLTSQIQWSAAAVPANIAEGHGRDHLGDYLHHLSIAKGSLMELETHLIVANRLTFVTQKDLDRTLEKTAEVGRMLEGLARKLREIKART